ncbi:MAG: gentisate 1,2-dioxygenase [Alphaproteobacteria bacterium HGW-Alphaproteobacteria-2]|nr:MAG: gentisate 1,2-dioxygenase [Alphaproteobacteria bacterium HGW-Alphaproteobacteria-2]
MLEKLKYPALRDAYDIMARASAVPLWEIYDRLVSDQPAVHGAPHLWHYAQMRPLLMDAGTRISATEAERRVIALKNPGLDRPGIAQTLFAGLQLVMPGEIATAHRHSQGAIRFVLESTGGYTAVNGERCEMRRGDLITTPSWAWHDHENTGAGPLVWLDGLDVPLVNFFGAKFAEDHPQDQQPIDRQPDDSASRWGAGLRPFHGQHATPASPVLSYPYATTRAALERVASSDAPDAHHGWKMIYTNPLDGGHILPTIAAFLQMLPAGFRTRPWRTTEATVFAVVEGSGTARIGDAEWTFTESDVFVAPNWTWIALEAHTDCVIFSFSDRSAQERLGIWRAEEN